MSETVTAKPLAQIGSQTWPLLVFRGVLAILLSLSAFFVPFGTAATIAIVVGIFCIVDGIVEIIVGTRLSKGSRSRLVLTGVLNVVFGLLIAVLPGVGLLALVLVVGVWAVVIGVVRSVVSVTGRKLDPHGWGWGLASGVLTVLFGIVVLLAPAGALLILIYTVAIWALIIGITLVAAGLRVRKVVRATS